MINKQFKEGVTAYQNKRALSDNPYQTYGPLQTPTAEYLEWGLGFEAAENFAYLRQVFTEDDSK